MKPARSATFFKGSIRTLGVDTTKLPAGVGRDFDDLFVRDEKGTLRARYPQAVTEDRVHSNKVTKRGLSYFLYRCLAGHTGTDAAKNLADIDLATNTRNPWRYLIFVGDLTSPLMKGDVKVLWAESDGGANTLIPSGNTIAGEGIRGIKLDDTSGILRRMLVRYPTTSPYRSIEYTLFAQSNPTAEETGAKGLDNFPIKSLGLAYGLDAGYSGAESQWGSRAVLGEFPTLQCGDSAYSVLTLFDVISDSETVTIGARTYTFKDTLTGAANEVKKAIFYSDTLINLKKAINDEGTAGVHYGLGTVAHEHVYCAGTTANTLTINARWQGGSTIITTEACANAYWTGGAMVPITKGRSKKWCHENFIYSPVEGIGSVTALHKYESGEEVTLGEGYVSSYEKADTALLTYTGVNVTRVSATKRITVTSAVFTSSHIRKTLVIDGTDTYTIKRIITGGTDTVEVFESVVDDGPTSRNAVVYTRNTGNKAFDGRCENYGKIYENEFTYDQDLSGVTIHGEKWISDAASAQYIGRIWATAKTPKYVRIVAGENVGRENMPMYFKIQYLKSTHHGVPGTEPQPYDPLDWGDLSDYSATDQSAYIMEAGRDGYEYTVTVPAATKGIRLSGLSAYGGTSYPAHIQEIMIAEEAESHSIVAGVSDVIRLSTANSPLYTNYTVPAQASTTDLTLIRDALIAALHGYELEAYINPFGFLMVRGTVAGNYSHIDLDTVAEGSTINEAIGLPAAGHVGRTGVTRPSTKLYTEAKVYIYTFQIAGDYPEV